MNEELTNAMKCGKEVLSQKYKIKRKQNLLNTLRK